MSIFDAVRARQKDGPPLLAIGPHSQPHADIALLRQCFTALGIGPRAWASLPGSALMAWSEQLGDAIEQYQLSRRVMADGICGAQTWGQLAQEGQGIAPGLPLSDQLPAEFVAVAKTQIGVHDDRANGRKYRSPLADHGKGVDEYLIHGGFVKDGEPVPAMFCALGLQWCVDRAAARLGLPRPKFRINAAVPTLAAEARAAGRIIAASAVQAGTVVYLTHTDGHPYHVEVCSGPVSSGHVPTIGFNTSDTSTGDGGCVAAKSRPLGNLHFVDACSI